MKELPEIFYIHSKDLEEGRVVENWFNTKYKRNRFKLINSHDYFIPSVDKYNLYGEKLKPSNHPVITFEEFQQYVLKELPVKRKKNNYKWLIPILKKYDIH